MHPRCEKVRAYLCTQWPTAKSEDDSSEIGETADERPLDYVDPFPFLRLREDLRRNVLEFVVGASWNGVRRLAEPWCRDHEKPEHLRVPFSAAASMRTLTFHARSIKAVCTAVATDVRLLEKTVAKPSAWLAGLWHVDWSTGTREEFLEACYQRAEAAGRGTFAAELYGRVETYGRGRRLEFTCPSAWSEERKRGARHLFDSKTWAQERTGLIYETPHPNGDRALAWAHARCRTAEQFNDLPTVDTRFMDSMCETAFQGFLEKFQGRTWTLKIHTVNLVYRGGYGADGHGNQGRTRGTPADYDLLDERLAAFFGAERLRSARWIQQWSLDDSDADEPPVTRIRDVRDEHLGKWQDTDSFLLTHDERDTPHSRVQQNPPVATIKVVVADDADSKPQPTDENDLYGDFAPPGYQWIRPLESIQSSVTGHFMYPNPSRWCLKIHTSDPDCHGKTLDEAVLMLPLVPGVFDVTCDCTVVGLN